MAGLVGVSRRGVLLAPAAGIVAGHAAAQARQRFLLLTGASGGAFADYGPVLAEIVAAHSPFDLDIRTTGGSNDNIRAVASGEADLGLINMGPAFDAWEGKPPFADGGPYRNLRALFPMYETPFGIVALRSSGVTGLSGLAGKTVGVGPAGGPGEMFFKGLAKALGMTTEIATGSPSDLARRVIAGEVDAFWYGAGPPFSAFVDVLKQDGVIFGLTDPEVAALRSVFAYFAPYQLSAGTYQGQAAPLRTVAVWNFVIASDRMPEDAAYALTRAALDHTAEMKAAFPPASGTASANVTADTFMSLHPGAQTYYREKGIALPPALTAT